ncbi:hypothetical protein C8F01DRAFT_1100858 [Mycena amicta]|nr:hypothetical protein C8F01DRAFT_1100858 [Mycena amicta]
MIDDLPPEIFARVLEIAIETWGIGFLPPIRLVSSTCNDIVSSTPSLWGIIAIQRPFSWSVLEQQLLKAKQSDIRLTYPKKTLSRDKRFYRFLDNLVALSHNWVQAELPIDLLAKTRASNLQRLQMLHLRGGPALPADAFFDAGLPALHSFTASYIPSEEWITGFLTANITYFNLASYRLDSTTPIRGYLARVPNLYTLRFGGIVLPPIFTAHPAISLSHLHNLEIDNVRNVCPLILEIRAVALRALSIRNCTGAHMSLVFSDWIQPKHLPVHLQTLELTQVLVPSDIPYLVSFLSRLPSLVRLFITYYESDEFDDVEKGLLSALASPDNDGAWLCPALLHLCLDVPLQIVDALPIARARGSGAKASQPVSPVRLRSVQVPLCSGGLEEEVAEFRSYFENPMDDVRCMCLSCSFKSSVSVG